MTATENETGLQPVARPRAGLGVSTSKLQWFAVHWRKPVGHTATASGSRPRDRFGLLAASHSNVRRGRKDSGRSAVPRGEFLTSQGFEESRPGGACEPGSRPLAGIIIRGVGTAATADSHAGGTAPPSLPAIAEGMKGNCRPGEAIVEPPCLPFREEPEGTGLAVTLRRRVGVGPTERSVCHASEGRLFQSRWRACEPSTSQVVK
jgi:hypothetical protein